MLHGSFWYFRTGRGNSHCGCGRQFVKTMDYQPEFFYRQTGDSKQCVRKALSNVLQVKDEIKCEEFQDEVKELESRFLRIAGHTLYDKKSNSDGCPCWQENWSLSVPLEWLKHHGMKGEVRSEKTLPEDLEGRRFLILAKNNAPQSGNHALAVVDGWLLDSLEKKPVKFETFANEFNMAYVILKIWEIKSEGKHI